MLNQSEMMNHSQLQVLNQLQSQSQQVMNNQSSQMMIMNQLNNQRGYGMWQPPLVDQIMLNNQKTKPSGYISARNNKNRRRTSSFLTPAGGYKQNQQNQQNTTTFLTRAGSNYHNPPIINELHQQNKQNRLKPKRYISKKKYNSSGTKSAPFAPRNTTSFLIRAKKSGGITSLVSPCPVTPAVLPTPIFSPSREVLGDTAKEEWGVDGYGSMKGLIRLRGSDDGNDEEEGGSSESDVEEQEQEQEQEHEHGHEHLEVEKRLDHDLSRFEMVYPNYGGSENNSFVLENRVDDQDSHIARLEEENLMVKERLFFMEREFENLRRRLRSLETRREGGWGLVEEVVGNGSENDSGSRGYGRLVEDNSEVFEENKNNVDVHMEDGVNKSEEKTDVVVEDNKNEDDNVNGDSCVNQLVM